jgi:DNA-binding NarL/FixJ family response regulator
LVTEQAIRPAAGSDAQRASVNHAAVNYVVPQEQIEVYVIEDHPLYRLALGGVLDDAPDMRVALSVPSVEKFAAAHPSPPGGQGDARTDAARITGARITGTQMTGTQMTGTQMTGGRVNRRPAPVVGAVVLLDLKLPGVSDAAAVAAVVRMGFRVLVLSAHAGQAQVLSAITTGAKGYLTKDAGADEIRRAVREVAAGNSYLPPALATFLLDSARGRYGPAPLPLSDRERQVLALLAAGERDQDIAVRLSISLRTVRSHLDRIREKTGRRRRPDLTRFAIEEGMVGQSWR